MNEPYSFDLFLSYAAADRAWVQGYLIPALGVPRERLITHDDFRLGAPRVSEIERAVTTSRYSILILSPAYLADEWAILGEQLASHLTTAEQAVRLIPLLKSECELPLRIDFRVRLDCTDEANWERETARLRDLLNQPAPQPERIECPYPGMIPFRVEDARWFYGRTKEIDELVRRIRVQNFLFVIGPSGSGKSSLVFAGLVAELNKRQPDTWLAKTLHPGSDPLTALNNSTIELSNHPTNQLLIIDQFEELFTQSDKPTQAAFIARLKSLRAENRCTIVVAMRADFYSDLMNSDLWPLDDSEQFKIPPLRGAALAEAIGKPAKQVGVYLETGLVERLLADVADELGALPHVQETMVLLWDKRKRGFLPLRAYEELGQGNLSGLVVAIATRADAVFAQLKESQPRIARRIFLRLVQFGEGRADTRRQQRVSALRASGDEPNEFDRTLKHLTDNRLLTLTGEEKDADRQVDIAHEALIAGWQRFRQWVNERREAEQTRRRLEDKAREWVRLGRGSAGLLDDVELLEAETWLKGADASDLGYSETLPELIGISRAEIQRAGREKEEARQRELAQAKALADEQKQRAETERRSRVRQRYFTIGLAVLLAIAIVVAGFAFQQTRLATSRELAASAITNLSTDPELSVLLATEGAHIAHSPQAEDALRQSLMQYYFRVAMIGHEGFVNSTTFSPDSKYILTASADYTARVWDVNTGKIITILSGHTAPILDAEFCSSGKFVVTASNDSTARVWDARTGQTLVKLVGHTGNVKQAMFSPDESKIVTGSTDGTARIWDAKSGQTTAELIGHSGAVNSAIFSPNGELVVTASADRTAKIWDAKSGQIIDELVGHSGSVNSAIFSPNGELVVTTSDDGTARVWDATNGGMSFELRGGTNPVIRAVFSPDSRYIATVANDDKTVRVWEAKTGKVETMLLGHTRNVVSVSYSHDGDFIVTASKDGTARIWNAITGESQAQLLGHNGAVTGAVFDSDDYLIATGSEDMTARIWNAGREHFISNFQSNLQNTVFSSDGKLVATARTDGNVQLWKISSGRSIATLSVPRSTTQPRTPPPLFFSAEFSPDGKFLVTAGDEGITRIWDITMRRISRELGKHTDYVYNASFSSDGERIITASADMTARIWQAKTGQELNVLRGHLDEVRSARFSPDGLLVVTGSADGTARVWDSNTGQTVRELNGHTGDIIGAGFILNGSRIITASADGTILVWDVNTWHVVMSIQDQIDRIGRVAFSHDGQLIMITTTNGTIQLRDAVSGKLASEWHLQGNNTIVAASFSLDDNQIVAASKNGTTYILPRVRFATFEEVEELARARVTRSLNCQERNAYLHEPPCPTPTPTQ